MQLGSSAKGQWLVTPAGGRTPQMGPHTSKDVAHLDNDASSPGIGASLLGRHAGGSARGLLSPNVTASAGDCSQPSRFPVCMSAGAWHERQEAVCIFQVMVDTSGWAFMYPLLRLSGVRVACYTITPPSSTDMLRTCPDAPGRLQ